MLGTLPGPRSRDGVGLALLAGILAVSGSYGLVGRSAAFVAVPIHSWEVDHMPAVVLQFAIVALGEFGDYAGLLLALAMAVGAFAIVAWLALLVADRRTTLEGVATGYALSWIIATALTMAPWASLGVTIPFVAMLGVSAYVRSEKVTTSFDPTRRSAIRVVGGLAAIGVGYSVGNRTPLGTPPKLSSIDATERAEISSKLSMASKRSLDLRDVGGLVTAVEVFYEVDIDAVNPGMKRTDWSLSITGAVDKPLTVDFEQLTGLKHQTTFKTLRCVGEDLNGDKLDNALWTGVSPTTLLEKAGLSNHATHVVLHAVDGYYEEFPLSALENGLLAFGMNGRRLPRSHGAPVRALIPNRWGEVNVKWLTKIEVIAGTETGYWEKREWKGTGPVTAVATLHDVERLQNGHIRVGGHAYAGTREVKRVEVSTNGGSTWTAATLSKPLPGKDVWRMWAHEYEPPNGAHEVVVRTVDGSGSVQTKTDTAAFPSGATGWVSKTVHP